MESELIELRRERAGAQAVIRMLRAAPLPSLYTSTAAFLAAYDAWRAGIRALGVFEPVLSEGVGSD